jgi:Protein of unknown function (DUF2815)
MKMSKTETAKKQNFLVSPVGRASYAHVFRPQPPFKGRTPDPNAKPKWSITLILDPKDPATAAWIKETKEKAKAFGESKMPGKKLRLPFRKGVELDDENPNGYDPLPPEYKGKIVVPFTSTGRAPKVVYNRLGEDGKRQDIEDESDMYSGCYVRVSFNFFTYDQQGNRGVSFGLLSVLKIKDGEPLGNVADPTREFESVKPEEYDTDNSEEFDDDDDL